MDELDLCGLLQLVNLRVMPRILYLLQVHIRSGAEPALLAKLNKVTADSAESVEDVSLVLLAQISGPLRHSLGYVLRHRFRRHGVPGLVINEHAPIKFAEQVVPLLPELLQVRVRRSQRGLILIAVLLARLVSIILLLVRFENSLGPLDDDDDLLVLGDARGVAATGADGRGAVHLFQNDGRLGASLHSTSAMRSLTQRIIDL